MNARLGFVGTGTITHALVTGLCTAPAAAPEMWVSPRSQDKARALAAAHSNVHVAGSNQAVLDHADIVVLAVLPSVARGVLQELVFRESHLCISLVAGFAHETVLSLIRPATRCVRATPTPPVAWCRGPIALYPPEPLSQALFARVGEPIAVASERQFEALLACSAEMASFFRLLQTCAQFLTDRGLPSESARHYPAALFGALGHTALSRPEQSFETLAQEHQTVGGINEQLARELGGAGVFDAHAHGLERIWQRLVGAPRVAPT